jgi:hypothetical protein
VTKELKKSAEAPGQQTLNSFLQRTGRSSNDGDDSTIPSGTENVQRNEQQPPSVAAQAVVEEETRSRNDPGMLVLCWSGFEVFLTHLLLLQMLLFRIIIASKKRRWWILPLFQRRSMMVRVAYH